MRDFQIFSKSNSGNSFKAFFQMGLDTNKCNELILLHGHTYIITLTVLDLWFLPKFPTARRSTRKRILESTTASFPSIR